MSLKLNVFNYFYIDCMPWQDAAECDLTHYMKAVLSM
jgi:hypothetical protein